MKHFIQLTDYKTEELKRIFKISDEIEIGKHKNALEGKTVVMFFPSASIRTRVTFEKGIHSLGGQSILFPSEALDKKEKLQDVIGYLNNWVDLLVIRHKDINVLREIAKYSMVPVINAMTDVNHPCEIISDLYAISKIREDFEKDHFLFCGVNGNIGNTWREASEIFNFSLEQCCPEGYEMKGVKAYHGIDEAIIGKDIICTDSISAEALEKFRELIIAQHGNPDVLDDYSKLPQAKYKIEIKSTETGYINKTDAYKIAYGCKLLGAGRERKGDTIDYGVGVLLNKKSGEFVQNGETLFTIYANNEDKAKFCEKCCMEAYEFCQEKPEKKDYIYEIIKP